jgi:hypothetical protein
MSRKWRLIEPMAVIATVVLASCGQPHRGPAVTGAEVEAVRARHVAYGEARKHRNTARTNDFCNLCLIMEPQEDDHGVFVKTDLGNGSLIADANGAIEFGTADVETSGDLAVSSGECSVTRTSPTTHRPVLRRGYCVVSWHRRHDGVWRIRHESRNLRESPVGSLKRDGAGER